MTGSTTERLDEAWASAVPGLEVGWAGTPDGPRPQVDRIDVNHWIVAVHDHGSLQAAIEHDDCGSWVTLRCQGHPRPYVVRRAGWIDLRGQPDGGSDLVGLGPGDSLVIATAAVGDARAQGDGERFDEEAYPDVLLAGCSATAPRLATAVANAVAAHASTEITGVTVFVLRVPPDAASDPAKRLGAIFAGQRATLPGYPVPLGGHDERPRPPRQARIRLEARPEHVRHARRFVDSVLHSWRMSAMAGGDAALLVSELATNAVRYAESPFTVICRYDGDRVRVELGDGSRAIPRQASPGPTDIGGRGIGLVDQLSVVWGVQETVDGKRVWFDLPVPPPDSPFPGTLSR